MNHDQKHGHHGHDHPQTIDAEPLEQTRSAEQLKEQQEKGREPRPDDEEEE